jgi:hypothetical protein
MMKAFLIGNKSICALPGGCHPVVASPVSELLYLCGLAGKGKELLMREFLELRYLKSFEYGFRQLEKGFLKRCSPERNGKDSAFPILLPTDRKTCWR